MLLTACGTGRGPARWGDAGASHLEGLFLAAGTDLVVLPFAELAYEASLGLTGHFHEHLRRGVRASEALRRARAALAEDPRFADPFYFGLLHARGWPLAAPFGADAEVEGAADAKGVAGSDAGEGAVEAESPVSGVGDAIRWPILTGIALVGLALIGLFGLARSRRRGVSGGRG